MMLGFNLHTSKQSLSLESVTSITNAFKLLHGKKFIKRNWDKRTFFFLNGSGILSSVFIILKVYQEVVLAKITKIPH